MNGQLVLDMEAAFNLLGAGVTESADPGVQAWLDYATFVDDTVTAQEVHLAYVSQSNGSVGADARRKHEQYLFWAAHQTSLYVGIDNATGLLAQEDPLEVAFIEERVVPNVNASSVLNFPSDSSLLGDYVDDFYPSTYPAFGFPEDYAPDVLVPAVLARVVGVEDIGVDTGRWR